MTRREIDLPPLTGLGINSYVPHAHIQGYDCLHDGTKPYVPRMEHLLAVKRVEAERDAALAEVERLEWAICHLLMRDGARHGGRVAVPLLARAVCDGAA